MSAPPAYFSFRTFLHLVILVAILFEGVIDLQYFQSYRNISTIKPRAIEALLYLTCIINNHCSLVRFARALVN